mmetsp:Transcript_40377/g.74755  ORF Transcript_40377/g.74755 Transcript_40377/m.74755 type:complete len:82 (+) Transcript_40377:206-451(+)
MSLSKTTKLRTNESRHSLAPRLRREKGGGGTNQDRCRSDETVLAADKRRHLVVQAAVRRGRTSGCSSHTVACYPLLAAFMC